MSVSRGGGKLRGLLAAAVAVAAALAANAFSPASSRQATSSSSYRFDLRKVVACESADFPVDGRRKGFIINYR